MNAVESVKPRGKLRLAVVKLKGRQSVVVVVRRYELLGILGAARLVLFSVGMF
jgi:hypothetical protein